MSNGINPLAERERAQREIAWLEKIIAEHPDSCEGARRMLEHEHAHVRRVEATMRAYGWSEES